MRRLRFAALCLALISAALSGCADDPTGPVAPARDVEALSQTDSLSYAVIDNGSVYFAVIDVVFTNQTGGTTYFTNCNGNTRLHLERLVDDTWKPSYAPLLEACLSEPIVVTNGAAYEWRIIVVAGYLGSNIYPQFATADFAGIYRIVWTNALRTYLDGRGELLPLDQRVSNRFALTVKRGVIPPPPPR